MALDMKKLDAPKNIDCVEATESSLKLTWDPVPSCFFSRVLLVDATGYMVMCKDVLDKSWGDCESASGRSWFI